MKNQAVFVLAVVAILFFWVDPGFGAVHRYEIIDLGPATARGINDAGHVVGDFWSPSGQRAFLWNKTTGMTDIGTLGGPTAMATAINDAGQVIGWSNSASGYNRAFLWDKTSGMIDLGTLHGRSHSAPGGINNAGQVVGSSGSTAFLWEDGNMIDLGTLGGSTSGASEINNRGQVVGGSSSGQGFHAFLWDSINGMRDLGVLPSSYSNDSSAYSINDRGQIVGISGGVNVFLWEDGEMIDLGKPGFYVVTVAINNAGQVVGATEYAYTIGEYYAFYWDTELGMIRLDELLPANSGWRALLYAFDINNRGQIVGFGITDAWEWEWEWHAFVMTPVPEPAIEAEIDIGPDTLNLFSKGKWITCYIWLPEDYDVADVNSNSVLLEDEVEPQWLWCDEEEQVVMVRFSRSEVQGILNVGQVELTVSGELTDGTVFVGTDVIRVLNKARGKSPE